MYNKCTFIGRLTRDPELRYVPSGHPVASFTLAVNRPFKSQSGGRETDFIPVVVWRKLAEQVGQYASKGRLVLVEGRLQLRSYEAKDREGNVLGRRTVSEIVADEVRFLDRKPSGNGQDPSDEASTTGPASDAEPVAAGGTDDEDVPF